MLLNKQVWAFPATDSTPLHVPALFTLLSSARFTTDCNLADYVVDVSIVVVRIKRTVPIVDNVDSTIIISAVSIVVSPIMSAATTFIVDL